MTRAHAFAAALCLALMGCTADNPQFTPPDQQQLDLTPAPAPGDLADATPADQSAPPDLIDMSGRDFTSTSMDATTGPDLVQGPDLTLPPDLQPPPPPPDQVMCFEGGHICGKGADCCHATCSACPGIGNCCCGNRGSKCTIQQDCCTDGNGRIVYFCVNGTCI